MPTPVASAGAADRGHRNPPAAIQVVVWEKVQVRGCGRMRRLLLVVVLAGLALETRAAIAQSTELMTPNSSTVSGGSLGNLPALPPAPKGKSTILGGEIRSVDAVRDQFVLHIHGQRPMKILFDERTQLYRDGVRIPLRELGSEDHASVQTVLDGDNVFAVSVHVLSRSPEGECQGRVLNFNPRTGELAISSPVSPDPVRLIVQANASVVREGQPAFTSASAGAGDLVPGTLVSASFLAEPGGRDVADRVTVLAVPGAAFVFSGNASFLDPHAGLMILQDPRDGKTYQVHFDPALVSASQNLHTGSSVTVTASYDGSRYAANTITVN